MKNKGFTLVELLAVIAILAILLGVSTVAVNNIRKKQDRKNEINVISSILTGAKEYNAKNRIENGGTVSVKELKNNNFVDFDENAYSDFLNKDVTKKYCGKDSLKVKYVFDGYNDCGCEKQVSDTLSNEICEE